MNKIWQELTRPRHLLTVHELLHLFGRHSVHHTSEMAYILYSFTHADWILGSIFLVLLLCHISAILLRE